MALRVGGLVNDGEVALAPHILLDHHAIGTVGHGSASKDARAGRRLDPAHPARSGERFADDPQPHRSVRDIFAARGVTVHRRHISARRIDPRHDGPGEHPPCGPLERHALGTDWPRDRADQLHRLVEADHALCQSPDLPPLFDVTSIPPIAIVRSTALSMSNKVRQATDTAVSASISTPVTPLARTSDATRNPGSSLSMSIATSTLVSGSGWHSGMSSAVRLAAMTPASSAVLITDPFGVVPARTCAIVSVVHFTKPAAVAVRAVTSLSDTSTMRARPVSSMWLSRLTRKDPSAAAPARQASRGGSGCRAHTSAPGPTRRGTLPSIRAGRRRTYRRFALRTRATAASRIRPCRSSPGGIAPQGRPFRGGAAVSRPRA